MVNLVIAGFSKCGTTTLYDMLKMHKDIGIGTSKEPAFFSKIKGFNTTKDFTNWSVGGSYDKGVEWYESIYRGVVNKKYIMDASTIYSFDSQAPSLIHQYNPNTKIIFIVREPYKRIESHYFQEVKTGMNLPDFNEFIISEHPRLNFYKNVTKYKTPIVNYINVFGSQNVYVTSLNALKDMPQNVLQDIFNFLNINETDFNHFLNNGPSNVRRAPRFMFLKSTLVSIERSKLAKKSPRFIQELGSKVMRNIDKFLLKEISNKPNTSNDIRDSINNQFKDDLDYLKNNHQILF
ncbi:sulfotransferase domain-containing protein [Aequorivita sp. F47161]|uniref:Sulfotransferase domain-containing protein n=1 Tax=Aequorivita vitellina TaxID=2874475 RepID=A0A9X1QZ78_9FLAO|nr:sulfotransferase domain-containing protein [Aequorivita vitellina]MCG2419773.1 sulfotransferase domain-containing protein [Aequorivita vitellina]